MIREKVEIAAFKYILELKSTHSKAKLIILRLYLVLYGRVKLAVEEEPSGLTSSVER